MSTSFLSSQNDQSTGEIKVIGGDDLSTLTGKVRREEGSMVMTKSGYFIDTVSIIMSGLTPYHSHYCALMQQCNEKATAMETEIAESNTHMKCVQSRISY